MITISDSSPLILLARMKEVEILEGLYSKVSIPEEVYREVVVRGKEEGYSDAYEIERNIDVFIQIKSLEGEYQERAEKMKSSLGSGESEALLLALQEEADILLADDLEVRKMAKNRGLSCRSTIGMMFEALDKDLIDIEGYENSIEELSKISWISPDVVSKYLKAGYRRCKDED